MTQPFSLQLALLSARNCRDTIPNVRQENRKVVCAWPSPDTYPNGNTVCLVTFVGLAESVEEQSTIFP